MNQKQVEDLVLYIKELEAWQKKGEEIMESATSCSIMFHIGQWWADRPWRDREKGND